MGRTQIQSYKLYLYLLAALMVILVFSAIQNGLQLRRYLLIQDTLVSISDNEEADDILREEFQWVGDDSEANRLQLTETLSYKKQEMWGKIAMLGMISAAEIVLFVLFRRKKRQMVSSSE